MDKKIAGLLGTVAAAALCNASPAAAEVMVHQDPLKVQSYAELLDPIPNAVAVLRAVDEKAAGEQPRVQLAQYWYYHHHHHHHHWYHHHHHHHHYWWYHHHHHHNYWRGYYHHHHHHHHHHYRRWED